MTLLTFPSPISRRRCQESFSPDCPPLAEAGINPDDHLPNGKGFELPVLPPASEIGRLKEIYA